MTRCVSKALAGLSTPLVAVGFRGGADVSDTATSRVARARAASEPCRTVRGQLLARRSLDSALDARTVMVSGRAGATAEQQLWPI